MRVLIPVAGGTSHLYPVVPLAWALRSAGHEVRLAGNAKVAPAMVASGLPAVTVGGSPRLSTADSGRLAETVYGQPPWSDDWPAHPDQLTGDRADYLELMGRYVVAVADALADDLAEFAQWWRPDLILFDPDALCAGVTASVLGVPAVRYMLGTQPALNVEFHAYDGAPLPEYVDMCRRLGLPDPPAGITCVDTVPSSMDFGYAEPHVDMRWVPYNGAGTQPAGLNGPRPRPRVCVTWGLVVPAQLGPAAADPFRQTIDAIVAAGAEACVLTTAAQVATLGPAPAHTRYLTGAPLQLVLPYCDAIVHHGGEGSMMAAAALGVPQLVITCEPYDDQCGGRLSRTGAGIHLRRQDLTGPQLRDAVDRLWSDPCHRTAAARLGEEIARRPSPADVVPVLAALA